jgi:tetratricopeptide (TPR) repeat protein
MYVTANLTKAENKRIIYVRTSFHCTLYATACLALVSWRAQPCCFAQDRVYPEQGVVASGKISEITPTSVKITVRGKDQSYEMSDVRKISFDNEPSSLDRVRESYLLGQYDQALDEVKKIPLDGVDNPLVKQDIEFYRYYCEGRLGLAGTGDKNAAVKGLLALASTNSRSHHLYEISELLGELAIALGQPEQAARYFGVLLSASDANIKATGVYRLGEVELAQNKPAEAKTRFEQLSRAPSNTPEMARLKSLAEVGLAVCEHLAGNSQQALKKLDGMVQQYDSTDQALFARINNAKGACYESLGKTDLALLSYLQTDLLFFTDAEAHAEALYHLTKLWPKLGEPVRAAEAKERLISQYASSTWANQSNL